jgi:hypothetical protein
MLMRPLVETVEGRPGHRSSVDEEQIVVALHIGAGFNHPMHLSEMLLQVSYVMHESALLSAHFPPGASDPTPLRMTSRLGKSVLTSTDADSDEHTRTHKLR